MNDGGATEQLRPPYRNVSGFKKSSVPRLRSDGAPFAGIDLNLIL